MVFTDMLRRAGLQAGADRDRRGHCRDRASVLHHIGPVVALSDVGVTDRSSRPSRLVRIHCCYNTY